MLTRAQVNDIVKKLPEEFSVDQLVEKLVFIDKVKTGLSQSGEGKINTKEQARQKLSKWIYN